MATFTRRTVTCLAALAATLVAGQPGSTHAQASGAAPGSRIATTVGALATYPIFFHLRAVRVRGTVQVTGPSTSLSQGDALVLLVGAAVQPAAPEPDADVEVTGTFFDVGRLTEGDPRLPGIDVQTLSNERLRKPWPGIGELLLVAVTGIERATLFPAPSVRALALAPERYAGSTVTVTGRFRGRNLYGDLPGAPRRGQWDFVLQRGEASIWVVGRRPRGPGFDLNVDTRIDTGRWLEVSGVVRRERGLVVLDAERIAPADPPSDDTPSEPVVRVPTVGPRPEVVFSVPTAEETDVARDTRIRIQFSRDLDPKSLDGQVSVQYAPGSAGERAGMPPPLEFTTRYDEGARTLEIRFAAALEPYRAVIVRLSEAILARDGALLVPWTLSFEVGRE